MLPLLHFLLTISVAAAPGAKWATEAVAFTKEVGLEKRAEIRAVAADGFPVDVPVRFRALISDPTSKGEVMWVTTLDYDSSAKVYIGQVLNDPYRLKSVKKHQNVLFRFEDPAEKVGVAITDGATYEFTPSDSSGFIKQLYLGVKAYRNIEYGHNEYGFDNCIATLKTAIAMPGAKGGRDLSQANYLLGRCYSESYKLDSSVACYKQALMLDSTNLDALLSGFSDGSVSYQMAATKCDSSEMKRIHAEMKALQKTMIRKRSLDADIPKILDLVYDGKDPETSLPKNTTRFKRH